MKNLKFLFLFLALVGVQTLKAGNVTPMERDVIEILKSTVADSEDGNYWAWVEKVAGLMNQGVEADGIKLRKDTTINIYGSGGMDNETGRICPNQANAHCAKIVISGMAVFDGGGTLTDPVDGKLVDSKSNSYSVTVVSIRGAREVEEATYNAEGQNVSFELNSK